MNKVYVYVTSSCDVMNTKRGSYTGVVEYVGGRIPIKGNLTNTTNYRALIEGILDAIDKVPSYSHIVLIVPTSFGMTQIRDRKGNWKLDVSSNKPNIDLLIKLRDVLIEKGHVLEVEYNKDKAHEGLQVKQSTVEPMPAIKKQLTLRLSNEMLNDLNKVATKKGIPPQILINYAIREYLDKQ